MALKLKKKQIIPSDSLEKLTIRVPKELKVNLDLLVKNTEIESLNMLAIKAFEEVVKKNIDIINEVKNNKNIQENNDITNENEEENEEEEIVKEVEQEEKKQGSFIKK